MGNFGSGWTWLVKKADGSVDIVNTGAAGTPLTTADKALLTVDVGTRLLHRLPQPASQVRGNLPGQAGQLEVCRSQLRLISLDVWFHQAAEKNGREAVFMGAGLSPAHFLALNTAAFTQLAARLDALLRKPALVHLQHVAHRAWWSSASLRSVASCRPGSRWCRHRPKAAVSGSSVFFIQKHCVAGCSTQNNMPSRRHFLRCISPVWRSWGDAATCASMPAVHACRDFDARQVHLRLALAAAGRCWLGQSGWWQAAGRWRVKGGGMVVSGKVAGLRAARLARIFIELWRAPPCVWRLVFGGCPWGAGSALRARLELGRRAEQQALK